MISPLRYAAQTLFPSPGLRVRAGCPAAPASGEPPPSDPALPGALDKADGERATVQRWAKAGLLPLPTVYYGLKPGKHSYWDKKAPAQAAWVAAQTMAGRTFEQIRAALDAGAFRPLRQSALRRHRAAGQRPRRHGGAVLSGPPLAVGPEEIADLLPPVSLDHPIDAGVALDHPMFVGCLQLTGVEAARDLRTIIGNAIEIAATT